jgi:SAM-dependent methyltransferase
MTEIDLRQFAPATRRNRGPLLEVLRECLPARGRILEIASGTGEHAVYFAHAFPDLTWQPSDPAPACRASIEAHRSAAGLANVLAPLDIDSCSADWLMADIDAVFCANMTHIAPWDATVGLLAGAGRSLKPGGGLLIYGPFIRDDRETAPSNLAFDRSLRARDPSWGLRRLAAIEDLARAQGLSRAEIFEMPANNLTLWFRKRGST